jgi:hypothetical protein
LLVRPGKAQLGGKATFTPNYRCKLNIVPASQAPARVQVLISAIPARDRGSERRLPYVREGLAPTLPSVSVDSILAHPRNMQRAVPFEPIKNWEYVQG